MVEKSQAKTQERRDSTVSDVNELNELNEEEVNEISETDEVTDAEVGAIDDVQLEDSTIAEVADTNAPEGVEIPNIESDKKTHARESFKKFISVVKRIVLLVAAVIFVSYAIVVITDSSAYFLGTSEKNSQIAFTEDIENVEELTQTYYDRLYGIAQKLTYAESPAEVQQIINDLTYNDNIVRFSQGSVYDETGKRFTEEMDGYAEVTAIANSSNKAGCSETFFDVNKGREYIAFFVPVRGSLYIDGIAEFIETENIIDMSKVRQDGTESLFLMDKNGGVVANNGAGEYQYLPGDDLRNFLSKLTHDESIIESAVGAMQKNESFSCMFDTDDKSYNLSLAPISAFGDNLWLVNLTSTSVLFSADVEYVRHVVNVCVISVVALSVAVLYLVFYYRNKIIYKGIKSSTDTPEGCPSKDVFAINAKRLLQNHDRRYALTILEIRQFRYLTTNTTEKNMTQLLAYLAKVMQAVSNARDTYGYLGDGRFAMLVYVDDDRTVKDRVRLVESVASKNPLIGASKAKRKFNIGISMAQPNSDISYQELLSYAEIACEKAKNNINVPYIIFNDEIHSEQARNNKIEAEMEDSLANGEFKLFLQPKYNVAADRVDSAEALVRWFDVKRGDYRFPGEFIGLFESNGFIVKLDHFMYIEALKFLAATAGRYDRTVPISVNVSLITVSDPEFINFYVENKRKYGIGDGFIVIEFTESFAMEDYQRIRTIVDTFHENGILCSLDDFGSGYSSLDTLKNIPFDEVKFDRLFLAKGYSKANDDAMIETMYRLTKSMGIKVVQEGVETGEMFEKVVASGCDAIQGYYYAKAISAEEYKLFIGSNTSIKYKSRVK